MNKLVKWAMIIFGIIALLSLLVGSFDWAAGPVASVLNKPIDGVKSVARTVALVAIAGVLIVAGIAAIAAAPFLGVVLLAVGIVTAVVALWPLFQSSKDL